MPSAPSDKFGGWLTAELSALFAFVYIRPMNYLEEIHVLRCLAPGLDEAKLERLVKFTNSLRSVTNDDVIVSLASSLSTRQLIRICKRLSLSRDSAIEPGR
jgi:hypothetical protein